MVAVGDCGPMGIGRGSNDLMVVVLVPMGCGSRVFTDLLVEGCESNLVVAGWCVMGLGRSGFGARWVVVQYIGMMGLLLWRFALVGLMFWVDFRLKGCRGGFV